MDMKNEKYIHHQQQCDQLIDNSMKLVYLRWIFGIKPQPKQKKAARLLLYARARLYFYFATKTMKTTLKSCVLT